LLPFEIKKCPKIHDVGTVKQMPTAGLTESVMIDLFFWGGSKVTDLEK